MVSPYGGERNDEREIDRGRHCAPTGSVGR